MSNVKICGLSREEDITAVNHALPDYIGFVFAAASRRQVTPDQAYKLRTGGYGNPPLHPNIKTVGVFVNEKVEVIIDLYKNGVIDMVQLHGDEDAGYIARLREQSGGKTPPLQIIKAVGVGDKMPSLQSIGEPDYILFDTLSEQRGGTGTSFDWNVLKNYKGLPCFLAGGLTSANAAEAITLLSPFCVDVSGGVETDGVKDAEKICEFVDLVRGIKFA